MVKPTFSALALVACLFTTVTTQAETTISALAEDLQQRLTQTPETLRWLKPNKDEPLAHTDLGIDPETCEAPVLARAGTHPRFLVRCVNRALVNFRVTDIQTLTSWAYSDGDWSTGQIIAIRGIDNSPTSRYSSRQVEYETVWHKGEPAGPYERSLTLLSETDLRKLAKFWNSFDTGELPVLESLEQWRQLTWPDAVVGLRRNGQLLLQQGTLAGTSDLLEELSSKDALPPFARGLIRPVKKVWRGTTPPGEPMFLLHSLRANGTDYALALSNVTAGAASQNIQRLSAGLPYELVFLPIERNL
ncbi:MULTISPECIES: hypothetical protein [Marinobacter]|uniref:hypothetical protein n=1 Tax=Marinobacter TaxID=2742 RepID=UPI003B43CAEA|nr:hypothetical protein PBN92_18755 [Marinobacter alkaliphilus]